MIKNSLEVKRETDKGGEREIIRDQRRVSISAGGYSITEALHIDLLA